MTADVYSDDCPQPSFLANVYLAAATNAKQTEHETLSQWSRPFTTRVWLQAAPSGPNNVLFSLEGLVLLQVTTCL